MIITEYRVDLVLGTLGTRHGKYTPYENIPWLPDDDPKPTVGGGR